jgi:hypothetical protein
MTAKKNGQFIIDPNNSIVDIEIESYYHDGLADHSLVITFFDEKTKDFQKTHVPISYSFYPRSEFYKGKYFKKNDILVEVDDVSQELLDKYNFYVQKINIQKNDKKAEIEEARKKEEYYNLSLGLKVSTSPKKGKDPFPKGMVGFQVYYGNGQYGPYSILRFADSGSFSRTDGKTIISPANKWRDYIPSVELGNNEEISDHFGFIGKFLANHVYENLFSREVGLDLRNYPIEIFDPSICEGIEHISQYPEIIEKFRVEWFSLPKTYHLNNIITIKNKFKPLFESFKAQFDETLEVVHEALQINLAAAKTK